MIPKQKTEKEELLNLREYVLYIFNPFSADFGDYSSDLALLLHHNLIGRTEEKIVLSKPTKDFIKRYGGKSYGSRGGPKHLMLKYNAFIILKQMTGHDPVIEWGRMDVFSPIAKIRVECGHTNPSRLYREFLQSIVKEFWVLRYPDSDNMSELHKFIPAPRCQEILEALEQKRCERLADKMLRGRDTIRKTMGMGG